jgi:2-oxoglutarate/2-oxoacid ferredoxin oxidoreductase subunit alpha
VPDPRPGINFMQGNDACTEGALAAGLKFFAGYPITPSTEIAERLAYRLPEKKGVFLQMEDELACISAIIGASWAGVKAMTTTSGPGFSLMQEGIGYAAMTETPVVVVHVMRGGPSTGQPTIATQADVMQVKWGSHGDYQVIALCPYSVQESYDLTVEAFNLSEKYRVPAILVSDAEIAHMRGRMVIPEKIETVDRKELCDKKKGAAHEIPDNLIPPFTTFGHGHRAFVTGMTHTPEGNIAPEDEAVQEHLVRRLNEKILKNQKDISRYEIVNPDAKKFIIAYGTSALAAKEIATENPHIGLLRLKTLWPLPEEQVLNVAQTAKQILVVEMNMGQLVREIQRLACSIGCRSVRFFSKLGGEAPRKTEIMAILDKMEV